MAHQVLPQKTPNLQDLSVHSVRILSEHTCSSNSRCGTGWYRTRDGHVLLLLTENAAQYVSYQCDPQRGAVCLKLGEAQVGRSIKLQCLATNPPPYDIWPPLLFESKCF